MKKKLPLQFAKNVLLLTVTGLLMRSVSLGFNLYLKNKLGSEGVGLFSLIMSVYSFAVTFATAGTALLVTRLVSEALGKNRPGEVRHIMSKCLGYALFFGVTGAFLLFTFAPLIGTKALGDARTVKSLRALAVSLPALALSSAFSGYFTAVRRVVKSAATQLGEQFLRIALTVAAFTFLSPAELGTMCLFVVLGGVVADLASFGCGALLFFLDIQKHNHAATRRKNESLTKTMLAIGLPVAFSSYFRSALVTVEHLLIPRGLRAHGLAAAEALAQYGILEAVSLPILMFPYAFLTPFCSLLVPEIAEKKAAGDEEAVRRLSARALAFAAAFGVGTAAVIIGCAPQLGRVIGGSEEAGRYLAFLAPVIPIMYADTTVDSLLKGVNEQLYTMRVNIADALLSVLLALVTVPRFGIYGYIFNIIFAEVINFSLSAARLFSTVAPPLSVKTSLLPPLASALIAVLFFSLLGRFFPFADTKPALVAALGIAAALYLATLFLLRYRSRRRREAAP